MRRIPGFFLFNIIIPCLVVTSFSVFTFAFPPEFGERVTLVIEAFLTISIVILNVAGSIPVTSDASPIIVKLLLANMFQIGFALIANCVSLNMYKKTEMPQWVRVLFLHYLARMLCIDTGYPKADVRKTRRVDVKVRNQKFLNQVWGFEHVTSSLNIGRKVDCYRKLCQGLDSEQSVFFYKADGVAHKVREPRGTPVTC